MDELLWLLELALRLLWLLELALRLEELLLELADEVLDADELDRLLELLDEELLDRSSIDNTCKRSPVRGPGN